MSMEQTYIGSDEWLMDLKEYYPRGAAEYPDDIPNVIQYAIEQTVRVRELEQYLENATYINRMLRKESREYRKTLEFFSKPIPYEEWHEDDGLVIWWRMPIEEPPYVGSPLCDDWTENYYTHFTRLIEPKEESE